MMIFKADDLKHIHRVLSSDIEECCTLLIDDGGTPISPDYATRIAARMEDDRRILEDIELVTEA